MTPTTDAITTAGTTISHFRRQAMLSTSSGVYRLPGITGSSDLVDDRHPQRQTGGRGLSREPRHQLGGRGAARHAVPVVRVLTEDPEPPHDADLEARGP